MPYLGQFGSKKNQTTMSTTKQTLEMLLGEFIVHFVLSKTYDTMDTNIISYNNKVYLYNTYQNRVKRYFTYRVKGTILLHTTYCSKPVTDSVI